MTEKSQNADSRKEKKRKKKRQYNNRKVFRRCRQTLNIVFYNNTKMIYYNLVDYTLYQTTYNNKTEIYFFFFLICHGM